jgi:hypothetical protein
MRPESASPITALLFAQPSQLRPPTDQLFGGRKYLDLHPGTLPSLALQLATIGQSMFSAICDFFAGLALRNFFKLR